MKQILVFILLLPFIASAQIHIAKDTTVKAKNIHSPFSNSCRAVLLTNGEVVYEGQKLPLGKGSLPNGDFNYIATASNTMESKLKRTTSLTSIQLLYIMKKGNKKYGYVYVFQAEGPRDGYLIQLEDAVNAGEIVLTSKL